MRKGSLAGTAHCQFPLAKTK